MKTDVEIACVCLRRKHKFVVTNFFNDVLSPDYHELLVESPRRNESADSLANGLVTAASHLVMMPANEARIISPIKRLNEDEIFIFFLIFLLIISIRAEHAGFLHPSRFLTALQTV